MTKKDEPTDDSQTLMKVLIHPRRRAMLRILLDTGEPHSPADLADKLDESLSNVGYHVRVLHKWRAIRLVGTNPTRGSIKHFYVPGRLVHRHRELVDRLPAAQD